MLGVVLTLMQQENISMKLKIQSILLFHMTNADKSGSLGGTKKKSQSRKLKQDG